MARPSVPKFGSWDSERPSVPKFGNWDTERPSVPKYGNWDSEDDVPYTFYFDKARNGKTGEKMINRNYPEESPKMFATRERLTPPSIGAVRPSVNSLDNTPYPSVGAEPAGAEPTKVPKFGEWDENWDENSYAHIFDKVREERARSNYNIPRNQKSNNKCCCFPWSR